ncbi:MAG: hypothetical protein RI883_355 [Bacteroidota bacterium]|jgi:uncharacterized protein (DUF2141 family)
MLVIRYSDMKLLIFGFLLLGTSSFMLVPANYSLTITVNGFSSNEGKASIAIYRVSDDFPGEKTQFKGKVVLIENKKATVTFENLPKANYAAAVFHDKNKNGVLDKNMFGVPLEKYGFSNNAREMFSAPSFESASVNLDKTKSIAIFVK